MQTGRLMCVPLLVLAVSCAESAAPVLVEARWNLTCSPAGTGCESLATTCLGDLGRRAIVGEHGQTVCTGDPIIATCEAVERSDGMKDVSIETNVDRNDRGVPRYAFDLRVRVNPDDGSVDGCNVTIVEDQLPYDVGACGTEPPSMAQPCQLSNISVEGHQVSFDLECDALFSSILGADGPAFDVSARIDFSNCTDF